MRRKKSQPERPRLKRNHGMLLPKVKRDKTLSKLSQDILSLPKKRLRKDHQLRRKSFQKLRLCMRKISKKPSLVIFQTMPKRFLKQDHQQR